MCDYILPRTCAKLIVLNLMRYEEEKGKEVSRARITKDTFRRLSGRDILRTKFKDDVKDSLSKLGWYFEEHRDTEFYLIKKVKLDNWTKISFSRVRNILDIEDLDKQKDIVDRLYEERFGQKKENDMNE